MDEPRVPALAAARVASVTPGRLRLRVPGGAEGRERLAATVDVLGGRPEISRVEARWSTMSVVVEFDPAATEAVWALLEEIGVRRPAGPATRTREGGDPEATRVLGALTRANELVARRTQGTDLRTLVPVGLGMLALRQFVRGEQRLTRAPWYVLAWYASETFQKFHGQHRGE